MNDFNFTFEDDVVPGQPKSELIMERIEPFLQNLKGDSSKDIIKWPGKQRAKQIDNFIKELKGIINE